MSIRNFNIKIAQCSTAACSGEVNNPICIGVSPTLQNIQCAVEQDLVWTRLVLSHCWEDGSCRPNAFASHSLNPAERKYGLGYCLRSENFYQYLLSRKFSINSDHKPLQHIFDESKPIPAKASVCLQPGKTVLALETLQSSPISPT